MCIGIATNIFAYIKISACISLSMPIYVCKTMCVLYICACIHQYLMSVSAFSFMYVQLCSHFMFTAVSGIHAHTCLSVHVYTCTC